MKRVAIDRFGRVLIPKTMRDQLNLQQGQEIKLRVEVGKLVLEPCSQEQMRLVDGLPVFDVEGQEDINEAITQVRSKREKDFQQ